MNETNEAVAAAPPKEKEKEPILIPLIRAASFVDDVGLKQCLAKSKNDHWYNVTYGWRGSKSEATRMTVSVALGTWRASVQKEIQIELVDQELAAVLLKRKCSIEGLLSKPIVDILRKAPKNPHARAHLLRRSGKTPPPEIAEFEALRAWVEENCEPLPEQPDAPALPDFLMPTAQQEDVGFSANCTGRYTESGSAHYDRTSSGRFQAHIHAELIRTTLAQLPTTAGLRDIYLELVNNTLITEMQGVEENWDDEDSITDRDVSESNLSIAPEMAGSFERSLAEMLRRMLTPDQLRARGIS